jgi:hypothetical protein
MSHGVLLALLAAVVPPQEATPTREKIVAELEERFAALGPVYTRAVLEHIDLGARPRSRVELEVHFRPAEFWMYSVQRDLLSTGSELHRLYEKDESYFVWDAKDADRVDNGPYYKWFWKAHFELDGELAKILGVPPDAKSLGDFTAGVKPELRIDLRSDSVDKPISRILSTLERGRSGGATWFENVRWAASDDIVVTAEEVIARFPAMGHETVIDRKTGFLKSVSNNFTTGDRRVLTVKEVRPEAKKPDVKKPSKFKTRRPGADDLAGAFSQFLHGYFHESLAKILGKWDTAGAPAKADALRTFFTMVAARRELLLRDSWHRNWTEAWLKNQRTGGRSLDDIIKNFDKCVEELKEYIEGGDERYLEELWDRSEEFKKGLQKRARDVSAPEGANAALVKRIEEAFDRTRMEKAQAKLPPTDYRGMLRDAIEEATRTKK